MYSTKYINKNKVDGNAYLSVGDTYRNPVSNMFRQPKKGEKLTPFVSKLMPENAERGNFSKITYTSAKFAEANHYRDKVEAKPGFGTKDASKTDEFCNSIRMEQYRQVLRKEAEISKKSIEGNAEKLKDLMASRTLRGPETTSKFAEQVPQYDIGRTRVNEYSQKLKKDAFYRQDPRGDPKFLGPYMPTAMDSGWDPWNYEYKPPSHGGDAANSVKNFYDKSHLKVGR